jgi:hypothetical protein
MLKYTCPLEKEDFYTQNCRIYSKYALFVPGALLFFSIITFLI